MKTITNTKRGHFMRKGRGKCSKHMRGHLGDCGLRMTASRAAIIEVLSKMEEHVSAEDVYLAAHKLNPRIGLTTVYRTLELLCRLGMVYKTEFGDGRSRFELSEVAGGREHHHHIVCTRCGKIINYDDFSKKEIAVVCDLQKELERKYKVKLSHHSVQYYGECEQCLAQSEK